MITSSNMSFIGGIVVIGIATFGLAFFVTYLVGDGRVENQDDATRTTFEDPCRDTKDMRIYRSINEAMVEPLEVCALYLRDVDSIPEDVVEFKNLLWLKVERDIREVPSFISSLPRLSTLTLDNNSLTTLPSEVASMSHLLFVYMVNNPISAEEQQRLREAMPNVRFVF